MTFATDSHRSFVSTVLPHPIGIAVNKQYVKERYAEKSSNPFDCEAKVCLFLTCIMESLDYKEDGIKTIRKILKTQSKKS